MQKPERTTLPLEDIQDAAYNPRVISDDALDGLHSTVEAFGLVQELVVNRRRQADGWPRDEFVLVGGHQRKKVLQKMGETDAPVSIVQLDHIDEKALNQALNNPAITGEFTTGLVGILNEIRAQKKGLYDKLQLDKMRNLKMVIEKKAGGGEETDADDIDGGVEGDTGEAYVPNSQPGHIYQLGPHRLACGDCTDLDLLRRLLDGEKATAVVTDPPYNLAGENDLMAASTRESYSDLKESEWDSDFDFADVEASILEAIGKDASLYVFTSHHVAPKIWDFMKRALDHDSFCVWTKPNPMPSMAKRHWTGDCELVCYGTRGKHTFNFPAKGHAPSTWPINKNRVNELHPTQKPVKVMQHPIEHSTVADDLVVDFFLGSGTCLMAAAESGRRCYGVEMNPLYCDRIRRRWTMYAHERGLDVGDGALYVKE